MQSCAPTIRLYALQPATKHRDQMVHTISAHKRTPNVPWCEGRGRIIIIKQLFVWAACCQSSDVWQKGANIYRRRRRETFRLRSCPQIWNKCNSFYVRKLSKSTENGNNRKTNWMSGRNNSQWCIQIFSAIFLSQINIIRIFLYN